MAGAIGVTGAALPTPPADAAVQRVSDASALRVGVLALVASIAAVGQTPALATALPFTTTSLADVLGLDRTLSENLADALQGTDLEDALEPARGRHRLDDGDAATDRVHLRPHGDLHRSSWSTTTAICGSAPTTVPAR